MGEINNDETLVEYNGRRIYPEVAEYLKTAKQSEWDYEDAIRAADRTYEDSYRALQRAAETQHGRRWNRYEEPYRSQINELSDARTRAYQAAEQAKRTASSELLLNSPHIEVKWIAENCLFAGQGSEVEGYAIDILKILPATTDEIWEEAKDNRGMCDVFDRFYDQAERAGIFTNGEKLAGVKEVAAFRSYIRRTYGSSYVRDMQVHLDRVLKAVREDYEAKLVQAKAEWQGLDEAYRSERSRRAAATRAANREAIADAINATNGTPVPQPVNMIHPDRVTLIRVDDKAESFA